MTYTNVQTFTFICSGSDDFVHKPSVSQEMKVELHTYWRQDGVYVSAEYAQGEEITVIVYENNERVIVDR
jgi:hypothetical protein